MFCLNSVLKEGMLGLTSSETADSLLGMGVGKG